MKLLVWHNSHGAVMAYSIPEHGWPTRPDVACVPGEANGHAVSNIASKGPPVDWPEWAEHLTKHPPYFGWWTIEDVPDGLSIQEGLSRVRRNDRLFGPVQE